MAERSELLNRKDLTGLKFGHLTVLEMLWRYNGNKRTYARCSCDCGNEVIRAVDHLYRGNNVSCGCKWNEIMQKTFRTDVTGQKFGRLYVIEVLWDFKHTKVRCLCDCGKEIIADKVDVVGGHTQSCGCLQKEKASEANTADHTGFVSRYGIKILNQHSTNSKGQWMWECECGLCGKRFVALPANIKSGKYTSCGCARQSSRERLINRFLEDSGVNFKTQIKFDKCRDEQVLFFDFGIYDSGNKLIALIEYDGKQHFAAVPMWGGNSGLKKQQKRDAIKNEYCLKNSIPLLRLPYTLTDGEIIQKIINIINP